MSSAHALVRHFQIMARANRLMNHRLHAACAKLSQAEFDAPRTNFFPSISATLNHILVVDWYYLDALEQGGRGAAIFADETPCGTMIELTREQAAADTRLIAVCDALNDDDLARRVTLDRGARGTPTDRIDRTLPHVFLHQTHHRGPVHAMLSGTPVAPPQLDEFLMESDDVFRVDDLAAVSMTEEDLRP